MVWQIVIVVVALAAIAVLLLSQQPSLLPITPEIQPSSGGVYSEALIGSFNRLNPILDYANPADRDVDRLIFSSLLKFDDQGLPINDLVESMGISQNVQTYNISLRENAVWHDGQPVTSEDVVFTTELLASEELPIPADVRELWQSVEAEALDERTLQFRLPEPYAPFLDYLTFGILPKHLLGDLTPAEIIDSEFNLQPVGSGPFRFNQFLVDGDQITGVSLSAFEDYYSDPAFVEQITFKYYPDHQSALDAYQSGDVLGVSQISNDILSEALREPNLNMHSGQVPLLSIVFLNLENPRTPFFQDVNIRKALLMGIDRQRVINQLNDGQAITAHGPIFPGSWAYYDGIEKIEYNPDAAIQILRAAGYSIPASGNPVRTNEEGQSLSFELVYPSGTRFDQLAQAIAEDWQQLGVEAILQAVDSDTLISDYLDPREYDAALVDINLTSSPDPDPYPFWDQAQITSGQNYSQWNDRQASEYLEEARVEIDRAERIRLYNNFQVRFATELPALPLIYPIYNYGIDQRVNGVTIGSLYEPSDRFAGITKWFLIAERSSETVTAPAETSTTP
ncbi:MAG: peptide ABC transporter substrate-binding protein [Chloroflexota bacterium]|nr:MAG: peptide ABC transporter substrate-binding protein [Chloroflexota bacterium]